MYFLKSSLPSLFILSLRPVTSASGRHVRLGTVSQTDTNVLILVLLHLLCLSLHSQASMLTEPGGPFVDISKLNLSKYAQQPALAKVQSVGADTCMVCPYNIQLGTGGHLCCSLYGFSTESSASHQERMSRRRRRRSVELRIGGPKRAFNISPSLRQTGPYLVCVSKVQSGCS